jgi:hypothetical protein
MEGSNESMAACDPEKPSGSPTDELSLPAEATTAKKLALLRKCDELTELTEVYESAYETVLRALAVANQTSVKILQDHIFQLRESIPHLEKKFIKRIKLVGTLTDIHKQTRKIKLKPDLARKKDLHKIDDFLLRSNRTLNALNVKRTQHVPSQTADS